MRRTSARYFTGLLAVAVALSAGGARASGFYFGDNGVKALMQGGAFTAQADDLTALQHNPAGLAQLDGWSFLVDAQLINHQVSFLRQDPGFDRANPSTLVNQVDNSRSGLFFLPFAAGSFGFKLAGRTLTVGLGVYGPPSQGRYVFPAPNYEKDMMGRFVESPNKNAAQRYSLISNDIIILYPSLSVAYALHPRFMVGASAQLVVSHFNFKQALFAGDALGLNPMRQTQEDPNFDALVDVDVAGKVGFTGIFGVLAKPLDWLSVGASVRPPVAVRASGTLGITLSDVFTTAGASVEGNQADLAINLPLELRVGVRATPLGGRLGVNADFVYQGWNSVDQILLTPQGVSLKTSTETKPVEPFSIPKNWRATYSARLGASFDVIEYLTVHAGVLYETGASPDEYYAIDFAHPQRVLVTGGVTGHLGPVDVLVGFAFSPSVQSVIGCADCAPSEVRRGQTDPSLTAGVVGAGIYNSGGFSLLLGVRGRFPPKPKATTDAPVPAPAAPPAATPEPAPAAPAAPAPDAASPAAPDAAPATAPEATP